MLAFQISDQVLSNFESEVTSFTLLTREHFKKLIYQNFRHFLFVDFLNLIPGTI